MKGMKERMDLKMLARDVVNLLEERGVRKKSRSFKHIIHITDDEDNRADFSVKVDAPDMPFYIPEVEYILQTCLEVIMGAMRRGENINVRGFGRLALVYREPRRTKDINTGEWIDVKGQFVPKFTFGKELKRMATLYQNSLTEGEVQTRIDIEGLDTDDFDE